MKKAIFFIGLPASGKSSIIEQRKYKEEYTFISADIIKEKLPDYDPQNPYIVHEQSVEMAEQEVYEASGKGLPICMDGGGVNNSYSLRIINKVKSDGYNIHLIYVKTPLSVCLERNKKRERNVPEHNIVDKFLKIDDCFNKQKELANSFEVIEYYTNKHIFLDMDGVLTEYQDLITMGHPMDYVTTNIFGISKPVKPIIETIRKKFKDSELYILSASPNSICNKQKTDWLKKHLPEIKEENIYFVGNKEHKAVMLSQLAIKLKLKSKDCLFIDDTHSILWDVTKMKFNAMHPSKFLAHYY